MFLALGSQGQREGAGIGDLLTVDNCLQLTSSTLQENQMGQFFTAMPQLNNGVTPYVQLPEITTPPGLIRMCNFVTPMILPGRFCKRFGEPFLQGPQGMLPRLYYELLVNHASTI